MSGSRESTRERGAGHKAGWRRRALRCERRAMGAACNQRRADSAFVRRHLMADPKARKVIVVEHPLMPTRLKALLAHILFENLHVSELATDPRSQ